MLIYTVFCPWHNLHDWHWIICIFVCVCSHYMCDWYDTTVSVSLCVCSLHVWLIWQYSICILVCVLSLHVWLIRQYSVCVLLVCMLTTCDWYDNTVSVSLCVCWLHMWLMWQYNVCILVCVLTICVTDTIQYLYCPCVYANYMCDWYDNTVSVSLCVCPLHVWLRQCLYHSCVCAHYMCDWDSVCILVCVLTTCVAGMTIQCILVCVPTTCVTDTVSVSLCVCPLHVWLRQCLYPCVCAHCMCGWYDNTVYPCVCPLHVWLMLSPAATGTYGKWKTHGKVDALAETRIGQMAAEEPAGRGAWAAPAVKPVSWYHTMISCSSKTGQLMSHNDQLQQ